MEFFKRHFKGELVQIFATLHVNLLSTSMGASMGWASSGIKFLSSPESDLEAGALSPSEAGFINSMFCVGGLIGSLCYGYICERIGRIRSMQTLAIPQIISYLLIAFAQNSSMILLSRIFVGISAGGIYICIPLFVSEISDDTIRGTLGSFFVLMASTGVLIGYIFGAFMTYDTCVWIYMLFPVAFLIGSFLLRETPFYLVKKNNFEKAESSILFYRGVRKFEGDVLIEFEALKRFVKHEVVEEKVSLRDFATKSSKKSIIIGTVLVWLEQFSGCYALLFYTASTFEQAGVTSISPEVATVIIGCIQLIGAYISAYTVDRAGRKVLICTSAFGIALGMTLFGAATQLIDNGFDGTFIKLIPVFALAMSTFMANIGVFNLTFVVLAEISPSNVKNYIFSFCMSMSWIFTFIIFILYLPMTEFIGLNGIMYFFAFNSILGGVFTIFCIPETMGKSLEEIAKIMEK